VVLSNHNGYNISCFGSSDGAIDVTVSGGVAPYTYRWSTGATTEDIGGLPAGYYALIITDAAWEELRVEYTLTEPAKLEAATAVYVYPNGKNLSCYQCFNGSITVQPVGGAGPYSYLWSDGVTTQHRYNLGAVQTHVVVTDANGCTWNSEIFTLTSPERSDWTMTGNAGSNPATQYLGTSDNKDLVFRTNGAERFRLKATGELKSTDLSFGSGYRLIVADSTGTLKSVDQGGPMAKLCVSPWTLCGTSVNANARLGTLNGVPLRLISNGQERIHLATDGKVGIGMVPPTNGSGFRLYVDEAIATREVKVTAGTWPDYVFESGYQLLSFDQLRAFIGAERHLPGMLTANEVQGAQGFELGDTQVRMLRHMEEQTLYILQLEERLGKLEALLAELLNTRK
jgi:hypothetical protein